MEKQGGFTLIELMVVMAIIAILATAGLSAYTGYVKKARDTTRIADINAINKIVLGSMSATGMPPQTALEVYNLVLEANNGIALVDPLASSDGVTVKSVCWNTKADPDVKTAPCSYFFRTCDGGLGYAIGTRFESESNLLLYDNDGIPDIPSFAWIPSIFEVGSCVSSCGYSYPAPPRSCPGVNPAGTNGWVNAGQTRINSNGVTCF